MSKTGDDLKELQKLQAKLKESQQKMQEKVAPAKEKYDEFSEAIKAVDEEIKSKTKALQEKKQKLIEERSEYAEILQAVGALRKSGVSHAGEGEWWRKYQDAPMKHKMLAIIKEESPITKAKLIATMIDREIGGVKKDNTGFNGSGSQCWAAMQKLNEIEVQSDGTITAK